jgi:hypothetical protein
MQFLCSSEAELSLKENLGKTFLEVASKVLPGISRLKAGLPHLLLKGLCREISLFWKDYFSIAFLKALK